MKTKIQIIQQLLDERKISAEDAIILMQTEKEYVYIPRWNDFSIPYYPYSPFQPYYTTGELIVNN